MICFSICVENATIISVRLFPFCESSGQVNGLPVLFRFFFSNERIHLTASPMIVHAILILTNSFSNERIHLL